MTDAVAAREASMYKKPREKGYEDSTNLTTIQKLAWNAHDKIFGMAAGENAQQKPKQDKFGLAAEIG